jgi:hypothetical protein
MVTAETIEGGTGEDAIRISGETTVADTISSTL